MDNPNKPAAIDLHIHSLVLGPLETNCYVIRSLDDCAVVDPSAGCGELVALLRRLGATPRRILLTHAHGDHIAGIGELKARWPQVRVCCPAGDATMLADADKNLSAAFGVAISASADELLEPGERIIIGASTWLVLDTSGHTPGGVSYHCAQAGVVITGDALFAGGIGRTDIPGASHARLLDNIAARLLCLDESTRVLPGHGPETTIGVEKNENPFF